jgi:transposase
MRQVHKAGEKMFVDYAGQQIPMRDQNAGKVHMAEVFVAVLGASNYTYAEASWDQGLESWINSHIHAYEYFGGVPKTILYDNLKSVVISRYVNHIQFNQKFIEFAGYYLFAPKATGVRKPHEKGKVESGVGYVEKNFLAGRDIRNFVDLEVQSGSWLVYANQRTHGTTGEVPEERFQKEKEFLLPLPARDPVLAAAQSDLAGSFGHQARLLRLKSTMIFPCGFYFFQ